MQDLSTKLTGDSLTATEWNQVPKEIQNVITALGISLTSTDLNQLGKAIAGYVANGNFYTDSGVADAYVLTQIGSKQAPTAYTDGFLAIFRPGNGNTGACTVNIATLGVKSIKNSSGVDLTAGDLVANALAELRYDAINGWFEFVSPTLPVATTTSSGVVELATAAEVLTGTDNVRAITPLAAESTLKVQTNGPVSLSGAAVDISIPSGIKKIKLVFSVMSTTGTNLPIIQVGTSGGIVTTGYSGAYTQVTSSSGTVTGALSSGFMLFGTWNATRTPSGIVEISRMSSTLYGSNTLMGDPVSSSATTWSGGSVPTASEITTVRITTTGGTDTFDAGSVTIHMEY